MMATNASASFHCPDWRKIDWRHYEQEVKKLQARIVKAVQVGRHGKVKALQWLLTHSLHAKALAIKRVTENQGKNTPGVDGIIWSTPDVKSQAISQLSRRDYRAQPLRRVYILKSNGKQRPLGIPTMRDRAMQALYLLALDPLSETTADGHSYGFRPQRATADAIEQCFIALGRRNCAAWVLEGDIKGCFDHINHAWLIEHIPIDKMMLQAWLNAGFIENKTLYPTSAGTPQGGIISAVLANLTLDGLQAELLHTFGRRQKINLVRYADDFIITADNPSILEQEIKPLVERFLALRGLTLSPEKTRITSIHTGFDFLGQHVRKYNGKLLITPAKSNIKTFLEKVRSIIKKYGTATHADLINVLNPVIRGWANYHRHVVAKSTFQKVDSAIWQAIWNWAVRRHPNKGERWIKRRYFQSIGHRHWCFVASIHKPDAHVKWVTLIRASDCRIKRHIKIKALANPYDPQWQAYFDTRKRSKTRPALDS